jgi:hypothetical protein
MTLEVAYDLWLELKRYINSVDHADAAETVVNLLIDHDHDAEDIKTSFKGDPDIRRALTEYLIEDVDSEEEDDDDHDSIDD